MIVNTFPDFEAIVRTALASANLTDIGTRWYSTIPGKNPQFPLGRVQRIGGIPAVRQYLDAASIQVDVWGENKSQARTIAAEARSAIFALEGTTIGSPVQAFISGVDDSLGLTWQPDSLTAKDRYIFGVIVYGRATAPDTVDVNFGGGGYGE